MVTSDLLTRTLERLEGNDTLYPPAEVVRDGINPAILLMVLLKPELSIQRTAVVIPADACFHDLRVLMPRCLKLMRVALGDHTGDTPVASAGSIKDLDEVSLDSLHTLRSWLLTRRHAPQVYAPWGRFWLVTYPRAIQEVTLTFVASVRPALLHEERPNDPVGIAEVWQNLIHDVAKELLRLKQGGAEAQAAVQGLMRVLGDEPFRAMQQAVGRASRAVMMGANAS